MDEYIEEERKFSPKMLLIIGLIVIGIIIIIIFLFSVFGNKKNNTNYDSLNQDIIKATQEYLNDNTEYKNLLEENSYISIPVSELIDKNLLLNYDKTDKEFKKLTDDMCQDISIIDEKEKYKDKLRLCGSILIYENLNIDEDELKEKDEEKLKELLLLNIDAYDKNSKKQTVEDVVEIVSINDSEELLLKVGENKVLYKYNDIMYNRVINVGDYKSCTIQYKSNYGENKIYKTIKTEEYDKVNTISSKPVRALYRFIGWSMDSANDDVLYAPNENIECSANKEIILYAMWQKNNSATYKILYYAVNNTQNSKYQKVKEKTIKNVQIDENGKVIIEEPINITGLKYNKEYTNNYYSGKDYFKIDLDGNIKTIYFYSRNAYKITLDSQGGNSGTTSVNCYTGLSLSNITIPKKSGYTFEGYFLGPNGSNTKYYDKNGKAVKTCDLSKTTTLYAKWKKNNDTTNNTATSTLVVDPNGGNWNGSTSIQSFTQKYSTTKYIAPPSRNGYTFEGWIVYNTNYGVINGTTYTFGIVNGVTNTLTASWREITYNPSNPSNPSNPTYYELTINPNGGNWNGNSSVQKFSQTAGSTKYIAPASRSGYTFGGWTLTGSGGMNGTTYTYGTGNGTLTSKWVKNSPTTTTLIVNPNGGSWNGSTSSQTFTQNLGTKKSISNPTRSGYTFGGWTVANTNYGNISGTTYTFGNTSNVTNTLTAKWNKINATLSLSSTSGSFLINGSSKSITINGSNYGTLSCSSSNSNIMSCSINGTTLTITPRSTSGTATITVRGSSGGNATYTATVKNITLSFSPSSSTIELSERAVANITGSNYGTISITSNCNSNVASCYISGTTLTVIANNAGSTSITIKESNANKTATYTITVNKAQTSTTPQEYYYCDFCESMGGNCIANFEPEEVGDEYAACFEACNSLGSMKANVQIYQSGLIKKYICTCSNSSNSYKGFCSTKQS